MIYPDGHMKKVSVIIPVYNAGTCLEKCIKSIQAQTLTDIEIICVDDGSTDNSNAVLKDLQKEDGRIRIIEQQNQGSAIARNQALGMAEGEYVAFVDADDFLLEETALETMYHAAEKEDMSVCGSLRSMERDGNIVPMTLHREFVRGYANGRKMCYKDYQYDYHFQNYIYKRSMLLENYITFPDYRRFQDPPFFVRAMIAAEEFWVVPVEYYCYHCEHENYWFSHRKVNDIVRGLTDILRLSRDAELKKLHVATVQRFNESYFWDIAEHCVLENHELVSLLVKANENVQWEWVNTGKSAAFALIRPLQWILQATEEKNAQYVEFENKHRYGYAVPFHKLKPNKKIILYAAGNVGAAYHAQLKQHEEYELVLWVDRNWEKLGTIDGAEISPPEQILQVSCDYILIALDDFETAETAMASLEQMGVDREKMIWGVV